MKNVDWIIVSQTEFDLARYVGPVVWINKCLRCGNEEPVYQGPLDVAIYQSKKFSSIHKRCLNDALPLLQWKFVL